MSEQKTREALVCDREPYDYDYICRRELVVGDIDTYDGFARQLFNILLKLSEYDMQTITFTHDRSTSTYTVTSAAFQPMTFQAKLSLVDYLDDVNLAFYRIIRRQHRVNAEIIIHRAYKEDVQLDFKPS